MKKSHRSRYINRFGGIFLDFHANVWYNKKAALAGFLTSLDGFFITYHDTNTTFNPIYFRLYQISTKRKRAENRHFCRISYTFGGGGDESRTRAKHHKNRRNYVIFLFLRHLPRHKCLFILHLILAASAAPQYHYAHKCWK